MEGLTNRGANQSPSADEFTASNSSILSTGLLYLPPTFLDAIIPGYSVLASTLLSHFGVDLSFYVSLVALFFVAWTALQVTIIPAVDRLFSLITSTVVIDEYDSIFDHILEWLSSQKSLQSHRILRASTGGRCDDEDDEEFGFVTTGGDPDTIFNFNDFATRVPAKYEPHSTTGFFRHKGHVFRITREAERVQSEWSNTVRDREKFIVTVVWRSTAPIKTLIEEARELSFSKRTSSTVIFRPTPKPQRGHENEWQAVTTRPSRSIDTVVLEEEQKFECLSDINEFLQAARWYANRGIPYRRGYLFHGAPGVGKTSLSFALAGVFGLEIYCLSLTEVTLTEEDLIMLFTALPQRCIVLLEDIDCAGVSRPRPASKKKKSRRKSKKSSRKSDSEASPPSKLTNAITISGLLNAIDGVATSEGRILIMTTNYPDKLDPALTRPGRIDMRVEFKLASKQQIKELFLRMYSADSTESNKQPTRLSQIMSQKGRIPSQGKLGPAEEQRAERTPQVVHREAASGTETPESDSTEKPGVDTPTTSSPPQEDVDLSFEEDDLEHHASVFASALPDYRFSPAEIQGFLLMHKKSPLQAVRNVPVWRDEELSKKNRGGEKSRAEVKSAESGTGDNAVQPREDATSEPKNTTLEGASARENVRDAGKNRHTQGKDVDNRRCSDSDSESSSDSESDLSSSEGSSNTN